MHARESDGLCLGRLGERRWMRWWLLGVEYYRRVRGCEAEDAVGRTDRESGDNGSGKKLVLVRNSWFPEASQPSIFLSVLVNVGALLVASSTCTV